MLDSLCRNPAASAAVATAAADALTASTWSQTSTNSRLQATDSAPEPAEGKDPHSSRPEDIEEEVANPTTSQDTFSYGDDSQAPSRCDDRDTTEQLVTDPLEGPSGGGDTHGGAPVSRDQCGSQRPARTPLAAVQEAVTPMLGSLSFKQTVHGKQRHGK